MLEIFYLLTCFYFRIVHHFLISRFLSIFFTFDSFFIIKHTKRTRIKLEKNIAIELEKKANIIVNYESIFNNRENSSRFEVYEKHTSYNIRFDTRSCRDEFNSKESIDSKIKFNSFSFDEFS